MVELEYMVFNYQKICAGLLSGLTDKQGQVLKRRFGLGKESKETLQKIGNDFGITRERVRQIERDGFAKLASENKPAELSKVFDYFAGYLNNSGGLKKEDSVLAELGKSDSQNYVEFLLALGPEFHFEPEGDDFFSFWALGEDIKKRADETISVILNNCFESRKPFQENQILAMCDTNPEFVLSAIEVSKKIGKGPLGSFGLAEWPEIKPRGVKDAAFLTLLSRKEPLHFKNIAKIANEMVKGYSRGKIILPQTVHNELIRDERFVLVGRGIYGLKDWGFCSGTVKDIIRQVLTEAGAPLPKEEILQAVKRQRMVKDNTIFLNLSDKKCFIKNRDGKYAVIES